MIVKLLTELRLEFLSLKGGCSGSSEAIHVKMSNCWISHTAAHMIVCLMNQGMSFGGGKAHTEDVVQCCFISSTSE